jgi:general secretion pathway protein G
MSRRRETGFTLLELLVVVGIIGILAAISAMAYFTAIDRARQKRTLNDMRSIATAWEARATDMHSYAAAGYTFPATPLSAAGLRAMLVPTYTKNLPRYDGWLRPFDLATGDQAREYAIRSRGRDGAIDPAYVQGETHDSDCDIIFGNGGFVTFPAGAQD